MTERTNSKGTIYGEYVAEQIEAIAKRGGGAFTFKEFAAEIGVKPTHNLRKRLWTADRKGVLDIVYALTGKCSTCYVYVIHPHEKKPVDMSDIPF